MIKTLKRYLINLLKSDNLVRYCVGFVVLIVAVIVFRCERQRSLDFNYKFQKAEEENINLQEINDSILLEYELLKIKIYDIEQENSKLRDSILLIKPYINKLSKHELKELWSNYKRYHLSE
jgi:predicted nuclease with TOPRIM domain